MATTDDYLLELQASLRRLKCAVTQHDHKEKWMAFVNQGSMALRNPVTSPWEILNTSRVKPTTEPDGYTVPRWGYPSETVILSRQYRPLPGIS